MDKINFKLDEDILCSKLVNLLSEEFEIYLEKEIRRSPGKFSIDGIVHNTVPDLLLKPKAHLIDSGNFIDTIIPVEIKKFKDTNTNKFEDLMFQCHSYRFSEFNNAYPKLCLYYIDNFFDPDGIDNHLMYDYNTSKDPMSIDYHIRRNYEDKNKIETLFGRFGIGEIITSEKGYTFRIKRQVLFQKQNHEISFKQNTLNFWWGNFKNSKAI